MVAEHEGSKGGTGRGKGWSTVRMAVQQYKILRRFQTLRHMSDGLLEDFDRLQYVCTLGGTFRLVRVVKALLQSLFSVVVP